MSKVIFRNHQKLLDVARLKISQRYLVYNFPCTKQIHLCTKEPQLADEKRREIPVVFRKPYHTKTHYLPYKNESPEHIEQQNTIVNHIDTLSEVKQSNVNNISDKNASMLYQKYIQKQTRFVPLVIRSEQKELLQDWNEILAIITDMKVVPEEADQVTSMISSPTTSVSFLDKTLFSLLINYIII